MEEKKYIEFRQTESKGKTKIFSILSKSTGLFLGKIKWDCSWRRYVSEPDDCTKWSSGCHRQIADFIDKLMEERKNG